MTKELSTEQAAKIEGVSQRRVQAKIKQGHYPHARQCECGKTWYLRADEIKKVGEKK